MNSNGKKWNTSENYSLLETNLMTLKFQINIINKYRQQTIKKFSFDELYFALEYLGARKKNFWHKQDWFTCSGKDDNIKYLWFWADKR